jgi:hypothetical protein
VDQFDCNKAAHPAASGIITGLVPVIHAFLGPDDLGFQDVDARITSGQSAIELHSGFRTLHPTLSEWLNRTGVE